MATRDFRKLKADKGPYTAAELGVFIEILSTASISPAQVAANTTAEEEFALPGAAVGDVVLAVEKPTHQAGLGLYGGRIDTADLVKFKFSNHTAAGITPTASQVYKVTLLRINK